MVRGLVGRPVVPDDPERVAEVNGPEHAGPVVAAERGVAARARTACPSWLTVTSVILLAEVEDDVAVGALEVAAVVEGQPLGDQQGAVGREAQRDVGVGDVGALRERRPGEQQAPAASAAQRGSESEPPQRHAGPGERLTCGVASAPAGASKNSRRSNPNRRATITAGKTWISVL